MQKHETKILMAVLVLSFLFIELIVLGGWGISVCIFVPAYYSIAIVYAKMQGIKMNKLKTGLLIPIALVTICFGIYNNTVLRFFNILLLYGLVMLQTSYMFETEVYKPLSSLFFVDIFHTGVVVPLANLTGAGEVVKHQFSGEAQGKMKVLFKVILGCVIAVPFLLVVIALLTSSDAAFEAVIRLAVDNFSYNSKEWITKGILTVLFFFPIYGLFYGVKNKKKYFVSREDSYSAEVIDPVISFTFITLLISVYLTYCLSQFAYFISAFKMLLPEGFTFAEYARRGFFELVPLSLINFGVILGLKHLTKSTNSGFGIRIKKAYIAFISLFTVFLIISALSKMMMYIASYGLTLWRVYTSWFLVLMLIFYIIVLIKEFMKQIDLMKGLFISFLVMFLGLNFVNVDRLIARYNVNLYQVSQEKGIDIKALYQLSSSAAGEVSRLTQDQDPYIAVEAKSLLEHYALNPNRWQWMTLASYQANHILRTID